MSRIGKLPVMIPDGVKVDLNNNILVVNGPKGELTKEFHPEIGLNIEDNQINVTRPNDKKEIRALHGLTRALIFNMVKGVSDGFQKNLQLVGVGYRAQMQGNKLVLQVGYSHPVEIEPEDTIQIEVPDQTKIFVKGIDKERVGHYAAKIRSVREPEPYKGKGIRYEGEVIKLKAGKTGKK
ncbi:LSU ribosomal protein L6P [Desulfonispora thiosulfatigenes DSM 11270]|uniref:Large ribosomal subunit protein uL6 n=1 Tax=Desulfonispora thiosulfatigenes DSM 11270 TaxID=656914 RepID=A0A1W1URU5_DESTI|nr:50S ribosomal protein L6 [Desulfonispora thiosulfatigenes]SMB83838.1 LSU ribosomal protein L6P [Desulfonispora thiosulfatigenes DSM 11270]